MVKHKELFKIRYVQTLPHASSSLPMEYKRMKEITKGELFKGKNYIENAFFRTQIPMSAQMLILLIAFFLMVAYHARLVEVTSRLDFLWKQQAERELKDMIESRHNNTQLLKNILPDHVALHFLSSGRNTDVRNILKIGTFILIVISKLFLGIIFPIQGRSWCTVW